MNRHARVSRFGLLCMSLALLTIASLMRGNRLEARQAAPMQNLRGVEAVRFLKENALYPMLADDGSIARNSA